MLAADVFTPCAELAIQLGQCEQINKQGAVQQIRLGTVQVTDRRHREQHYPRRFVPG